MRMAELPFSTLFQNLKKRKGEEAPHPWKKQSPSNSPPRLPRSHKNYAENSEHHFQARRWFGAEDGGRQSEQHKPTLERRRGEETLQETLTYRAQGRTRHRKAVRPVRSSQPRPGLQSNGPLVTSFALGTEPPSSAPAGCRAPRSEFDFEFCGLCGHRGPRGLEERLQDGVGVHLGRRVGGGGRVRPARQLALLSHRGAVTQPPVSRGVKILVSFPPPQRGHRAPICYQ